MGAGVHVMSKILSDEKIEADEVVYATLKSGADSGIKAAIGGALEIAVEKGIYLQSSAKVFLRSPVLLLKV